MKCVDFADSLAEYVDGALAPHEAVLLEAHLSTCSECAAEVADLRRVMQLVRELEPVEVPPSFRVALRQRLRALPPPRPAPLWRRLGPVGIGVPATIAAGLVGLAIFTFTAPSGIMAPPAQPRVAVVSPTAGTTTPAPQPDAGSPAAPQPGPSTTVSSGGSSGNPTGPGAALSPRPAPTTAAGNPKGGSAGSAAGAGDSAGSSSGGSAAKSPANSLPTTPGSQYLTGLSDVPTSQTVTPPQPTGKHFVYSATATVAVPDAGAALKSLEDYVQTLGGQVAATDGQVKVMLPAPADKWSHLIEYIRGLGTVQSIAGDAPVETTDAYNRDYADYTRQQSMVAVYREQIKSTTDPGVRAQMESALQPMQEYLDLLENELKKLDAANSHGQVTLTLVAASTSAATHTTASVAHSS